MRGDGSLSLAAFMEIGPLFEQAQIFAEEILDQADKFYINQAKIVDPPRNQTNGSARRGEDQADSTTPTGKFGLGWIRDPGIDPRNELNPSDPKDGHQNYPFCYKI